MKGRVTFEIEAEEVFDGVVKITGNGAHVLVPKKWVGAKVKVVRLAEPSKI